MLTAEDILEDILEDANSVNPLDPVSQVRKQNNQGQPLPIHVPSIHTLSGRQQMMPQRTASTGIQASLDLTTQMGNPNGGDWQEEVYQKIKAMKDLYLLDLNDMHQKILDKLQQQPKGELLWRLKVFKNMLERFMQFLQTPKHGILANHKDKLGTYEKQIVNAINSRRRKCASTQQQSRQTYSQMTQMKPNGNKMNLLGSIAPMQQNSNLQKISVSSLPGGSNPQQNMMTFIQPSSTLNPAWNSSMNSLQQVAAGSLHNNPGGSGASVDFVESGDWKAQLPADSRPQIVNQIRDSLKRHLPYDGDEGLRKLKKLAQRLELFILLQQASLTIREDILEDTDL